MFKAYHKYMKKTFTVYDVITRDNNPFFLIHTNTEGWCYFNSDNFIPEEER